MKSDRVWKASFAGIAGGLAGNGILGLLFSSDPVRSVLYNENLQSKLFISLTPERDLPYSVGGLIVLSAAHGLLFEMLHPALPGRSWFLKGVAWGGIIWLMYWVFQEWFIYHTLLGEPLLLAAFELLILLTGSLVEGIAIAALLRERTATVPTRGKSDAG
ncbi:MAG: hypothetical protein ABR538_05420 [Candidatus Binatia bacterium]